MRILVGVKRVLDYTLRPPITSSAIALGSSKMSLNPFCAIALEAALRLRASGAASSVLAVSIGPSATADTLRHALALGADAALHIRTDADGGGSGDDLEARAVARVLQGVVKREGAGMVILGKQAIDGDQGVTGGMLAGMLEWPQVSFF